MRANRILAILPYAALFTIAALFYYFASQIDFTQRGDNPGPDFWPKLALAGIMIVCIVQGLRLALSGYASPRSLNNTGTGEGEDDAPRSAKLLAAGLLLTAAYGFLINIFGFLIATAMYMILFIYIGKYRSHKVVWLSSIIGAVTMTVLFQKAVYVSLPRGVFPFNKVSDILLSLF